MAHGDALPEQSTTKLERAQWDYDRALLLRDQAQSALAERDKAIGTAREALEQAKREAAATIPVDRSAVQLSGGGPVTEDHREIKPESGLQKGYRFRRPPSERRALCGRFATPIGIRSAARSQR